MALDVNDEESMTRAVREIEDTHRAISVLVNNAGYGQSGAIEAVQMDRVRKQFRPVLVPADHGPANAPKMPRETNVFGLVCLTQLVLPKMRAERQGGSST